MLGISDALNINAVEQTVNHQLKLTQEYLIQKKVLDFDLTDEPLPMQHYSFRRHNEQRMPPKLYKELRFLNLEYYDDDVGCKLLFIQADPMDWGRLGPLWMHLEQSGYLRKIFRLAVVHEVPKRKVEIEEVTEMQTNKLAYLRPRLIVNPMTGIQRLLH